MTHLKSLSLALLASAAFAASALAQDIVLRSSDTHPDGYPTVDAVKYMGELLSERTDGRITVEVTTPPSSARSATRSSRPSSA